MHISHKLVRLMRCAFMSLHGDADLRFVLYSRCTEYRNWSTTEQSARSPPVQHFPSAHGEWH